MPLKMFVKVGNITHLSDARYCAGMGVDLLGFSVIEGQENYISPKQFQEIRGWISGPGVVAQLYGITSTDAIASILENYRPDYLELGAAELSVFKNNVPLPYILAEDAAPIAIGAIPAGISINRPPAYIQVSPGSQARMGAVPVLVSVTGKIEVDTLPADIHGISLNGGKEIRPGLKAHDELNEILELLDVD